MELGRRGFLALAGSTLLAGGTGCEALRGEAVPEAPLWAHRPGGALSVFMRRLVTDKTKIKDQAYERGKPAIDSAHLRVFVGSQDGGLYALDARTGDTLWRFNTKGPVQCEPLYDPTEDVLYFGSTDGALYKARARDGKMLYRFDSNAEIAEKPVIEGKTVFFMNANDTLVAIDRATGKLKWYQARTPAFGIEVAGYSGCAVGGGRVVAAFSDGSVMAYATSDGAEQWPSVDLSLDAQAADGQAPQYLDADATPILATLKPESGPAVDGVLVAHFEGGIHALEAASGRTLWTQPDAKGVNHLVMWEQPAHAGRPRPDGSVGPDAPARRVLLASSGRTGLWGMDPDTGAILWRNKLPEGGMSAPVPISGAVLVTTTRYGIFLFEPTRGGMIDGIEPGNEIAMTPAVYGQRAYVMTNGGELIGVEVRPPVDLPKKKG
jgi:outer membrane protein assembly factor BamB